MFWISTIAVAVAIGLIQLGALSVWVVVLKTVLAIVLATLLAVSLVFAWRRYRGNRGGD